MSRRRRLIAAGAASAALWLCGAAPADRTPSPDGRWVAVIDDAGGDADPERGPASILRIEPATGGPGRVLLRGRAIRGDDPKQFLHSFERPFWSLDGGYVYIQASAWATSAAVHQVDVRTGSERFVVDGGMVGLIRTGPYRGMLLVARHKYHPAPEYGSYDPVDLVRPDGKRVLTVPGSDKDEGEPSVSNWLKAHGWRAD